MKYIKYFIEFLFIISLFAIFKIIGLKNASALGEKIGITVGHLFRSKNLDTWEYIGPLIESGFMTEPGEDGAVPNFLPIGNNKHILLFFSHKRGSHYFIGDYDDETHKFEPL